MSRLSSLLSNSRIVNSNATINGWKCYSGAAPVSKQQMEDEFRVLNFTKKRERLQRKIIKRDVIPPPRIHQMKTDQNWSTVWSGPKSFNPSSVPLPIRQGYVRPGRAPPAAVANAELMKIPNFLHLTPPAVRSQCEALKKFCSPWPANIDESKFPLEVIYSDYCHSGPVIRNPLSRIMNIRIKLSALPLDKHARDKLMRLVRDRYDAETDTLSIVTDRCPLRQQNLDYAMYLLTAVYHESWNVESWEADKMEADMEEYIWDKNESKAAFVRWCKFSDGPVDVTQEEIDNFDVGSVPGGVEYKNAVSKMMNEGENDYNMNNYREAVLKLFGLKENDGLDIAPSNRD